MAEKRTILFSENMASKKYNQINFGLWYLQNSEHRFKEKRYRVPILKIVLIVAACVAKITLKHHNSFSVSYKVLSYQHVYIYIHIYILKNMQIFCYVCLYPQPQLRHSTN
jgi:hypothetical protein